jgi:hypothetical protein
MPFNVLMWSTIEKCRTNRNIKRYRTQAGSDDPLISRLIGIKHTGAPFGFQSTYISIIYFFLLLNNKIIKMKHLFIKKEYFWNSKTGFLIL